MTVALRGGERLDASLVARGLAPSREKAQGLVMAGQVRVNGVPVVKCGARVAPDSRLEVTVSEGPVSRGALKLDAALAAFAIDVSGRVGVDVGASTGGFTEVLLARGASRVYAVDVGYGQLHERLRNDSRVLTRERVNARHLTPEVVEEPCGIATLDVSFISALKLLPALVAVLAPGADVVALVKPQFEVGRFDVGPRGIVTDPALHRRALLAVAEGARQCGYCVVGACPSPITGAEGNREFFLHLRREGPSLEGAGLEAAVEGAVGP
jgi:23S rRNA (cytidine1920-2'-O)/16S rRNA (cytidine1409-2'-O)-methyltransferase